MGEIIYIPQAKRVFRKENPDNIEVTAKIVYENGKGEYADEDGKRPHDIGYIHNGTTYLYRYERLTAKSCVYSYARGVWYRCGFGEAGVKNNPTKDNTIPPTIKVLEPGTSTWVDGYLIFGKAYSQKGIRPQDGAIIDMRGHKVYNSDGTESADYVKYNKAKDIGEPYEYTNYMDITDPQRLAQLILEKYNHKDQTIVLKNRHDEGTDDKGKEATAYYNILHTSQGVTAWTSDYGNAPGHATTIDYRVLRAILALEEKYGSIHVTEIAGASHSINSIHYTGRAFDFIKLGGVFVEDIHNIRKNIKAFVPYLGTTAGMVLGPKDDDGPADAGHGEHMHIAWA